MPKNSFYITTTIPYINADPHIGFALELVQSDAIARYQRLQGAHVFFSTGTDEYGQKIWEAAQKEGKDIKDYVDYYAEKFLDLKEKLNLSTDNFIRTTSDLHVRASQEVWNLCQKSGDIYKKKYKGLYCVGCEKFLTERDMEGGKCILHPSLEPQTIEEENYFFRLSKYREKLLEYLAEENAVIPEWKREEAVTYVRDAMEDFSISRSKERLAWGIPIPGDDEQVMYVWFGAFVNYISTLGWPDEKEKFEKFWVNGETVQTAGKDMVKFQSVMWQGMLMSAGLPTTDTIVYHGFVTGEGGIRMSKTLGNVINPFDVVAEYGTDALRYFLLGEMSSFEDSPFTMERFKDAYNAKLANGLGNLVSRVLTMAENYNVVTLVPAIFHPENKNLDNFDVKKYMDEIWEKIQAADKKIQEKEPYKIYKTDPEFAKNVVTELTGELSVISYMLTPVMPNTAETIFKYLKSGRKPEKPLFVRKD